MLPFSKNIASGPQPDESGAARLSEYTDVAESGFELVAVEHGIGGIY
jgi:hypothetical protein